MAVAVGSRRIGLAIRTPRRAKRRVRSTPCTSMRRPSRRTGADTSASRSATRTITSSIECLEQRTFEVAALRDRQHLRVIERLTAELAERDAPPAVGRRTLEHFEKERFA